MIDYLKSEKLIYIVPLNDKSESIDKIGGVTGNSNGFSSTEKIVDNEFLTLLNSYYQKNIIPTEYLVKYYERDCIGEEETRFKKALSVAQNGVTKTTIAIWIAILVGLTTIFTTIYYAPKPDNRIEDLTKVVNGFILEQREIDKEQKEINANFQKELLELKNNQTEMMKLIKNKQ